MDKWADSPDNWKYLIFGGNYLSFLGPKIFILMCLDALHCKVFKGRRGPPESNLICGIANCTFLGRTCILEVLAVFRNSFKKG